MNNSEFLTPEEMAELTGYSRTAQQKDWLDKNGLHYKVNAAGRPIVNRLYARMAMAGVTPTAAGMTSTAWTPDFSVLR